MWAKDVPVVDSFAFGGLPAGSPNPVPFMVPATVNLYARFRATGPQETLRNGAADGLPPSSPFLAELADASARGWFSGSGLGFSFKTKQRLTSDNLYAALGHECNGVYLKKK